jgi:ABC-type molybdate transport system substrate-binding protein
MIGAANGSNNGRRRHGAEACRHLGLRCLALVFALLAWPGHLPGGQDAPAPVVFAAASMKTALDAVAESWKASTGKAATITYASSATLAKQIAQGAPADIFISADLKWMDSLEKENLIRKETRRNRFGNKLVLIAPADSTIQLEIAKGFDLAGAAGERQNRGLPHRFLPGWNLCQGSPRIAWRLRRRRTKTCTS